MVAYGSRNKYRPVKRSKAREAAVIAHILADQERLGRLDLSAIDG
jgi:hypothetical protein